MLVQTYLGKFCLHQLHFLYSVITIAIFPGDCRADPTKLKRQISKPKKVKPFHNSLQGLTL